MTTITKQVKQGDSVSIQATPNTGYTFTGWTEGGDSSRIITDNPYTFTPDSNTSIDAVFSEATPIISWVGNPGNLVIKNSNGQTHNLWSAAGTNKYFGDVEGFGANDIVSVWISGNDPGGTSSLIEHTWLTELNLSGLTNLTLGQRSFANCTALTTVVLPTSSYSIASINGSQSNHAGAFQGCTALSSLTLGGCTSIGAYAFYGCSALRTVNIPGSCTTIGTDAFYNAGIATLTMAEGIQSIGDYAFVNNYRMTSVSFPSTLSSYGKGAFSGCYGLATIRMNNYSGTYYTTSGNCLYEISSRSVVLGCKISTIPTSSWNVNKIFDSAFNEMIKSGANVNLTIPSNITSIGNSAFYGCDGLTGVSFSGSGLTTLMAYAFYGCTGLTTITLPSSFSYFGTSSSSTGTYCFGGCTNLATVYMNSISTPPTIYRGSGTNTVSISLFPSTIQKIYIKPGTMSSYQADTNGWDYWYNQKKLYIGIGISSDVSPAGSSTVSKSSNNVEFQSDSAAPTVILTATPTTGYTFSSWNRGNTVLSNSNPYTATVVDDGTGVDEFTAISTVSSYSISASINPSGGGTVSGTGSYSYGDSCTVSATSNTGYDFVNWTEDGSTVSSSSSYTFTVSQARTLVANFELQTITISAGPNTSGYGTVSGNSGTYSYGDTVSLTATAASGYEFTNWTENGTEVSTSASYSFTATQDRTLVANFAVASYTISASASPYAGGSVSGGGSYNYGDTCTLRASYKSGYAFSKWTENGTQVSTSSTYSFTVSGNRTLVAVFTVRSYTISASVSPSGGGTVSGTGTKNYGTTCTLTATANTGYVFSKWTESGTQVSTSSTYSFSVSKNRTLVANFTVLAYSISASVSPSGSGSVSGTGYKNYGTTATLVATANSGYEFVNWTQNGSEVSTSASYSFTVSGARALVANFQQITPITITTTGSTTVYLKNNSDEVYTWNLSSGTNTYSGNVSGFELSNLKSIYKYTSTPSDSDFLITSIDISGTSITNISERSAWGACRGLTSVIFPETITTFGREAFWNCSALANITLPASVSSIGRDSFNGCTGLSYIRFKGSTVPSFLSNSFSNTNNCTIYVPSDAVDTYKAYSSIADRVQAWPY